MKEFVDRTALPQNYNAIMKKGEIIQKNYSLQRKFFIFHHTFIKYVYFLFNALFHVFRLGYLPSAEPTQSSIAALSLSDVTTDLIGGKKGKIMDETLSGSGTTLLQ